jgi:ribosomal protein S27E
MAYIVGSVAKCPVCKGPNYNSVTKCHSCEERIFNETGGKIYFTPKKEDSP